MVVVSSHVDFRFNGRQKHSVRLFCLTFRKLQSGEEPYVLNALNTWITEQKKLLILRNWVHFVPIF